ncbi:MAG: hypothetical protein QXY21_02725 [Candidatus Micrarchaeaceae archaeon]
MLNIYELKHYKWLIAIPIVLLLVSLYFIPHIPLDSSLRGGITITAHTQNASLNLGALTSEINSKIPGAMAELAIAPGGITIVLAANQSLANAEQYLLDAYSAYGNYTAASVLMANINASLAAQPGNETLKGMLEAAKANMSVYATATIKNASLVIQSVAGFASASIPPNATPSAALAVASNASNNANNFYKQKVISTLQSIIPFSVYSYETITPTLGSYFLSQLDYILIVSFVLVAIVVFFIFRTIVPSLIVVYGAVNDIVIALGAMGAFGIPLGVASIGGLLMLIGYSIDTDILSAIRILKRSEDAAPIRAFMSMKTGLTMTATALIVFTILFAVSYISFIQTYYEIAGVVLAGLIGDILATWFGNTAILLWYKERKDLRK